MPAFPPAKPQRVGSWSQRSRLESAAHLPRPPRAGVSSGRLWEALPWGPFTEGPLCAGTRPLGAPTQSSRGHRVQGC